MQYIYNFVIQPLILVYDVLYTLLYRKIEEPVIAILALSVIINLIALPLYRKADLLQKEEINKNKKMEYWLAHFRQHFKGDERFMMTQAYYRIEHYSPLSVLKEAGPLALQIPFFMAAYRYISNIPLLETATFGPITNLLEPDGLLKLGGVSVNILPIIMTAINMLSGYIYSKDGTLREKIQIYGIATVFLVLLYNSASGLVIYWIMNQLFSLCKNIVFTREIKEDTKRNLKLVGAVLLIVFFEAALLARRVPSGIEMFIVECIIIISVATILLTAFKLKNVKTPPFVLKLRSFFNAGGRKATLANVLVVELCFAALWGFYIPSSVLSASPTDFADRTTAGFPYELLVYPTLVYCGLMLLWMTVILFSKEKKKRERFFLVLWVLLGIVLVNHFCFDPKVGNLYIDLTFDGQIRSGDWRNFLNILACAGIAAFFGLVFIRKSRWIKPAAALVAAALIGLGCFNVVNIQREVARLKPGEQKANSAEGALKLSKDGKNVIVFMLDRAIGGYLPFIFEEKPELKDSFEGFVYYPNTVSFGLHTKYGSPGLFGGYEYNPLELNKRTEQTNVEKHNEALSVMPVLFWKNGYHVTVCDAPLAGYEWTPDMSFFNRYLGIETKHLVGAFSIQMEAQLDNASEVQKRNFVMYSIFRSVPLTMKETVYDRGKYISLETSRTLTSSFINSYSALEALGSITSVSDDNGNVFIMLDNDTPHNPTVLNPPDYDVYDKHIGKDYQYSDKEYEGNTLMIRSESHWGHYCANMVMYQALAKWLDYLKTNDVYDNTRIIIVADHGYFLDQYKGLTSEDGFDVEAANPLLLIKDFDSRGLFSVDNTFMCNADVPTLAMQDLIDNPVNPFTGNRIQDAVSKNTGVWVIDNHYFDLDPERTYFDFTGDNWWTVHDNIFDLKNWEMQEEVSK